MPDEVASRLLTDGDLECASMTTRYAVRLHQWAYPCEFGRRRDCQRNRRRVGKLARLLSPSAERSYAACSECEFLRLTTLDLPRTQRQLGRVCEESVNVSLGEQTWRLDALADEPTFGLDLRARLKLSLPKHRSEVALAIRIEQA